MDPIGYFHKLFEYDHWGNLAAIESLSTIPAADGAAGRALKLIGHLVGAERTWLARLEGSHGPASPWEDLTTEECHAAVDEVHRRWQAILGGLSPEKLAEELVYRNTKGAEFRTPIEDVLTHLVMHSAYHRGQVALAVRDAGGKPAQTDYIVYVRQSKRA